MFNYFAGIYCINLDEEEEKWERIKQELSIVGIKDRLQRFSAIKDRVRGRGASRSHLELIKMAQENNLSNILIFEDDTKFIDWNPDYLQNAITNLPQDWQIFNIGYNICCNKSNFKYKSLSPHLIKVKKGSDVRSNNAYAVNSTAFKFIISNYAKFLNNWENHKTKWHLDLWYAQNFDRYCLVPLVSVQDQGEKPRRFIENFSKHNINLI